LVICSRSQYTRAYIDRISEDVNHVKFTNHINDNLCFNKNNLLNFAIQTGIHVNQENQPYESYFNKQLENILSAICQHPDTKLFEEGYNFKFEPCDLFTDDTLYFVKIGEPSDFALALDQAYLTLQKLKSSNKCIELKDGKIVSPENFKLILVFDKRKTYVEKWLDIKSLNFLIHLSELRNNLSLSGINLHIDFCYETKQSP